MMGLFRDFYEPDPRDCDEAPNGKTCRHCGAVGLWWLPLKRGQYRLTNADGTQHNCQRGAASSDEFDDLTTL